MNNQQSSQQSGIFQHYAFAKWLIQIVPILILPFFRWDLGCRVLNALRILFVNGALIFLAALAAPNCPPETTTSLVTFAVLSTIFGFAQRLRRSIEMNQGTYRHSQYYGTSPFNYLRLPAFLKRNRRTARFLDPICCFLIALLVYQVSPGLSVVIAFAAFCLRAHEADMFQSKCAGDIELADRILASQAQMDALDQFLARGNPIGKPSAPIKSGMDKDLEQLIKNQKKENQ